MLETRIRIGDTIRLTHHYLTFPAGSEGIITHVYRYDLAAFRARFTGQVTDDIVYRNHFMVVLTPHQGERG
jgi:hypothetical protein